MLLMSVKTPPYNYSRMNMWHNLGTLALIAYALLGLIENVLEPSLIYMEVFLGIAMSLVFIGIFLQSRYYPSLLVIGYTQIRSRKRSRLDQTMDMGAPGLNNESPFSPSNLKLVPELPISPFSPANMKLVKS